MNMKIGARLNATFACVLALMLVLCVVVNGLMAEMQTNLDSIVNQRVAAQHLTLQAQYGTTHTALYLFRGVAEKTVEAMRADIAEVDAQAKKNTAFYKALQTKLDADPQGREVLNKLTAVRKRYNEVLHPAHEKMAAGDVEGTREVLLKAMPVREELVQAQMALDSYEQKAMDASIADSVKAYNTAKVVLWGTLAVAFAVAVLLCVLLKRSIVQPLSKVVEGANALAAGDLSMQVPVQRKDEVGEMAAAVNLAIAKLASLVGKVKAASESIASASHQVASGAGDLSQRTEEQAASLEETASSMEELTATVRQTAEHAQQANGLAKVASSVAGRGGEVVERVVNSMQSISAGAARMTEIIGVIEGIAFQTNILALNAAVEAARAGEHGRGFNVVAAEVRALAQRSATAAKEVKDLIGQSDVEVREGSALAQQAGETIREVVASFERVTGLMTEVANASGEQSSNIEHVNNTIAQMDQVTQQNAALVEETSAASDSMAEQVGNLHHAVSVFKLPQQQVPTLG